RELLSTRERMSAILARLSQSHDGFLPFTLFFTVEEGRLGVVVTFLAMMELVKEGLVTLLQNAPLAPIHLQAKRA
ncbi:MAG TPA: segregation/condensation protein A, partial [Pseudomonadales bacterium]|nr:segregation/condensation protein A [Pseudomonadales bacterium]